MPLVWAHAEHVKLRRSLREGRVFDLPPQPGQRYLEEQTGSPHALWRFNHKSREFPAGQQLRVEVLGPAVVRWSADDWATVQETATRATGLGVHVADLATAALPPGTCLRFTFYWPEADRWEGGDFAVTISPAGEGTLAG